MPERFPGMPFPDLRKGDYFEGLGAVWKVTHEVEREDGRWLGFTNAAGEQRKSRVADHQHAKVTVLVYETVGRDIIADKLGGKVLAEKVETKWFHPAHSVLEADEGLLRAHLVRFHEAEVPDDLRLGDLIVQHRGIHTHDPSTHEHNEEHRA